MKASLRNGHDAGPATEVAGEEAEPSPAALTSILSTLGELGSSGRAASAEAVVERLKSSHGLSRREGRRQLDLALQAHFLYRLHSARGPVYADPAGLRASPQRRLSLPKERARLPALLGRLLREWAGPEGGADGGRELSDLQGFLSRTYALDWEAGRGGGGELRALLKEAARQAVGEGSLVWRGRRLCLKAAGERNGSNGDSGPLDRFLAPSTSAEATGNGGSSSATGSRSAAAQSRKAAQSIRKRYLGSSASPAKRSHHGPRRDALKESQTDDLTNGAAPVELKGLQDSLSTFFKPSNKRRSRVAQSSYSEDFGEPVVEGTAEGPETAGEPGEAGREASLSPVERGRGRKRRESESASRSASPSSSKRSGSVASSSSPRKRQSQVAGLFDSLSVYFAADAPRRSHPPSGNFAQVIGMRPAADPRHSTSEGRGSDDDDAPLHHHSTASSTIKESPKESPPSSSKRRSKPLAPHTPPVSPPKPRRGLNKDSLDSAGAPPELKAEVGSDDGREPSFTSSASRPRSKGRKTKAARPESLELLEPSSPPLLSPGFVSPKPEKEKGKGKAKKVSLPAVPDRPRIKLSKLPEMGPGDRKSFEAARAAAVGAADGLLDPTTHRCPEAIQFGSTEIQTWYSAPYPQEYARLPKLFVCEFCLKYMKSGEMLKKHGLKCRLKRPPGREVYRAEGLSVFEVDGNSARIYCQNMCLLAKLFLDHKTLYYDVEPFLFYVLTRNDRQGSHFLGYFSKEKYSLQRYNLSCIVTLPCFQGKGFGRFLIDFSFLLSRREETPGTPERPLSDLGKLSYHSYWRGALLEHFHSAGPPKDKTKLTISSISKATGLSPHDVVDTLQGLRMLTRKEGKFVLALNWDLVARHWAKAKADKRRIWLQEKALKWSPTVYASPVKDLQSPLSPVSLATGRLSAAGHRSPPPGFVSPVSFQSIALPGSGSGGAGGGGSNRASDASSRAQLLQSPVAAAAQRDLLKSQKRKERRAAEERRESSRRSTGKKGRKEDSAKGRKRRAAAANVCYTETSDSEEERQRRKLDRSLEEEEDDDAEEDDEPQEEPCKSPAKAHRKGPSDEDSGDGEEPPPSRSSPRRGAAGSTKTETPPEASGRRSSSRKGGGSGGGGRKAAQRYKAAAKRRQRLGSADSSESESEDDSASEAPSAPPSLGAFNPLRPRPTSFKGVASKPQNLPGMVLSPTTSAQTPEEDEEPEELRPETLPPEKAIESPPEEREPEVESSELMEEALAAPSSKASSPVAAAESGKEEGSSGADSEESVGPASDEDPISRCSSRCPASEEGPPTLQIANPSATVPSPLPEEEEAKAGSPPKPKAAKRDKALGSGSGEEGNRTDDAASSSSPPPLSPQLGEFEPCKEDETMASLPPPKEPTPDKEDAAKEEDTNPLVNVGGDVSDSELNDSATSAYVDLERPPKAPRPSVDEDTAGGMLSQSAAAILDKLGTDTGACPDPVPVAIPDSAPGPSPSTSFAPAPPSYASPSAAQSLPPSLPPPPPPILNRSFDASFESRDSGGSTAPPPLPSCMESPPQSAGSAHRLSGEGTASAYPYQGAGLASPPPNSAQCPPPGFGSPPSSGERRSSGGPTPGPSAQSQPLVPTLPPAPPPKLSHLGEERSGGPPRTLPASTAASSATPTKKKRKDRSGGSSQPSTSAAATPQYSDFQSKLAAAATGQAPGAMGYPGPPAGYPAQYPYAYPGHPAAYPGYKAPGGHYPQAEAMWGSGYAQAPPGYPYFASGPGGSFPGASFGLPPSGVGRGGGPGPQPPAQAPYAQAGPGAQATPYGAYPPGTFNPSPFYLPAPYGPQYPPNPAYESLMRRVP